MNFDQRCLSCGLAKEKERTLNAPSDTSASHRHNLIVATTRLPPLSLLHTVSTTTNNKHRALAKPSLESEPTEKKVPWCHMLRTGSDLGMVGGNLAEVQNSKPARDEFWVKAQYIISSMSLIVKWGMEWAWMELRMQMIPKRVKLRRGRVLTC
mmetsp:Transcript_31942/g.67162  ORF Transcript_31942/g.67162 Transcript_31942/m.67162 type:complete len:153 (+) Transcript_31942:684-1142(+)